MNVNEILWKSEFDKENYLHKVKLYEKVVKFQYAFFQSGPGNEDEFSEKNIELKIIPLIKRFKDKEFIISDSTEPVYPYIKNYKVFSDICKLYNKKITIITGQNSITLWNLYKSFGFDVEFIPLFNYVTFGYMRNQLYSSYYKNNSLEKRFFTLNRTRKVIRELLYNKLKQEDLLKYGEYSFNFVNQVSFPETPLSEAWLYVDSIVEKYEFNKNCFLNFVIEGVNEDYFEFENQKIITNYISEKAIKALYSPFPFIILGEVNMMNKLNEYGFKTFNEFWDEGYDKFENRLDRFEAAFDILRKICFEDNLKLRQIYNEFKPIFDYNVELADSILEKSRKTFESKLNLL